jgi:hypothetical protein
MAEVMRREGLSPRLSYKLAGEQIDGSFVLDYRVMLIEAKWVTAEIAASQVYSFKGKVDGKLAGTLGIFLSINGFSKDAVDALLRGKEITVILATGQDLRVALSAGLGFGGLVRQKLRAAAEDGQVLLPLSASQLSKPSPTPTGITEPRYAQVAIDWDSSPEVQPVSTPGARLPILLIGTESPSDARVLQRLTERIAAERSLDVNVEFLVAGGRAAAVNLAATMKKILRDGDLLAVAVDADGTAAAAEHTLGYGLNEVAPEASLIIMEPELEEWIGVSEKDLARKDRRRAAIEAAEKVNISEFEKRDKYFAKLVQLLTALDGARKHV